MEKKQTEINSKEDIAILLKAPGGHALLRAS